MRLHKLLLVYICGCVAGCGMVVGTIVDTSVDVLTYPLKEYVFGKSFKYDNTWEKPYQSMCYQRDYGEMLLGVSVSGGGSRSAYFFACVLEQLQKLPIRPGSNKSYADEIDYISSVSGGSLASAYYCLTRYQPQYRENQQFFADFKTAMQKNFEIRALWKMLYGYWLLSFFTYYDRGDLMASVWDDMFFDDAVFDDLLQAEQLGAPTLIINGTNLNDGLKFVFTTLEDDMFNRSQYFQCIRHACFIKPATIQSHIPFETMGFTALNSDIRCYPLSKAVVASAAVPNLLGPVTLKNHHKKELLHIIDGGIYDNYGIESLMQVFTTRLDQNPGMPAKILIIDGSGFFDEQTHRSDNFSVAYYSERPIAIAWLRTKSYMEYVFQKARQFTNKQGIRPYRNLQFELLSLYDLLPSQQEHKYLSSDVALQTLMRPDIATEEFLRKITAIQTRFTISDDDAQSIERVAIETVQKLGKHGIE